MTRQEARKKALREAADQASVGALVMSAEEFEQRIDELSPPGRITVGVTAREKLLVEATRGLEQTAGLTDGRDSEFFGRRPTEIAREFVYRSDNLFSGNKVLLVGRALTTTDFPKVLENVASKSLLKGFDQAPETFDDWCDKGTVLDFKDSRILKVSALAGLKEVPESAEYQYGSRDEERETVKIATYGRMYGLSRETIVNDDLSALTDLPFAHGEVAARKIGDLAYAVLTDSPDMGDGVELFHSDHSNIMTPGVIGTTSIAEGIKLMRYQKDISGNRRLNIRPMFFIAPAAIEGAAEVFFRSDRFDSTAKDATRVNPYSGNYFTRVYDTRLDDVSEDVWYLAAARGKTVKLFFLEGYEKPYLEARKNWSTDGVEYKIRIDAAAKALDWRGLSRNAGV